MFHVKHKKGGPQMYINPFWAGVLVTIAAEAVLLIVAAAVAYNKEKNKKRG